jgi:hypothetical protein
VDCIATATSLANFLSYVSSTSTDKSPSKACCGEVKTVMANPVVVNCLGPMLLGGETRWSTNASTYSTNTSTCSCRAQPQRQQTTLNADHPEAFVM